MEKNIKKDAEKQKKTVSLIVLSVLLLSLPGVLIYLSSNDKHKDNITILCGMSMQAPLEKIKKKYKKIFPDSVIMTKYGDSKSMLKEIEITQQGDIYICHYPFMNRAMQKQLISKAQTVGYLKVVIAVPKGNPKGIKSFESLKQPGLKLGIGDSQTSGSGIVAEYIINSYKHGSELRKNITMYSKGNQKRASEVVIGNIDAALIWNSVGYMFRKKLEVIPVPDIYFDAISSATIQSEKLKNIDVKVGLVKFASSRTNVQNFYHYLTTEGETIFNKMGFAPVKR